MLFYGFLMIVPVCSQYFDSRDHIHYLTDEEWGQFFGGIKQFCQNHHKGELRLDYRQNDRALKARLWHGYRYGKVYEQWIKDTIVYWVEHREGRNLYEVGDDFARENARSMYISEMGGICTAFAERERVTCVSYKESGVITGTYRILCAFCGPRLEGHCGETMQLKGGVLPVSAVIKK